MPAAHDDGVTLTLSAAQVETVLRCAHGAQPPAVAALLSGLPSAGALAWRSKDPRMSRSLLRGLALLARFAADPRERGIVELADELQISASTAHRYAHTLVELGLLERCPSTRKYRVAAR